MCAVGHRLVQDVPAAKRDLTLPRQLRKLDKYDFLLPDDLGYLPQGAEEFLHQPHGHGGSYRPGGPPIGHPGIQRPQPPDRRGPATGSETEGEPARIICEHRQNWSMWDGVAVRNPTPLKSDTVWANGLAVILAMAGLFAANAACSNPDGAAPTGDSFATATSQPAP